MSDDPTDRDAGTDDPSDEEIVRTAAKAAEDVVFAHYRGSEIDDLDVTVTFEDGVLDVDVYLNVPTDDGDAATEDTDATEDDDADPDVIVQEAVEAAGEAVDDLFDA